MPPRSAVGWLGSLPMYLGTGGGRGKLAATKVSFGFAASVAQSGNRAHPAGLAMLLPAETLYVVPQRKTTEACASMIPWDWQHANWWSGVAISSGMLWYAISRYERSQYLRKAENVRKKIVTLKCTACGSELAEWMEYFIRAISISIQVGISRC